MLPFLEKTVKYVFDHYRNDVGQLCIVLPNRRASLFLKKYIAKEIKTPIWAPQIFSIEDFVAELSGIQILDNVDLLFEFYQVYLQHTKTDIQPFEEFVKWAPTLLNDFNEVDSYLVNGEEILSNLGKIKNIENWSLAKEELTEFQKNYLQWWDLIGIYYKNFCSRLSLSGKGNQGMAYRMVANAINEKDLSAWKKIIFAGFNALNAAEEKIIKALLQNKKADVLWDSDSYYLNNPMQEAGKFIRKHKSTFFIPGKDFLWEENMLSAEKKNISIAGVAKSVLQTKVAGTILAKLNLLELENTAVVLANESLLEPLLHSLPENIDTVNITMGFPLSKTPIVGFFDLILVLHENAKDEKVFYHKDIIRFARHPYSHHLFSSAFLSELIHYITSKNKIYVSPKSLKEVFENQCPADVALFDSLLKKWTNSDEALSVAQLLLAQLLQAFKPNQEFVNASLDYEYTKGYSKIIARVQALQNNYKCVDSIQSLRQVINQLVRSASLPFYGEPLHGLQIMGMLETRTLDFETVVLLSANENILPENKSKSSFIPFDLKKAFGLPTYSDNDAIYAYHFYRLIQRAKNIHLIYNTENDGLGKGEKSRFITQLLYELPKINTQIKLEEKIIDTKIVANEKEKGVSISKTREILERIEQKATTGFSPSLLNTYKNCSLQFYFQYIAGLKETEEVEEKIGADVLGNAIHKTLEELYLPLVGKQVGTDDVTEMKKLAPQKVENAFEEEYGKDDLTRGKNLLTVKIAEKFLQQFLTNEEKYLSKNKLQIEALEKEFEVVITLPLNGSKREIKLKGKVDRIDIANNSIRIIDYKTGLVEEKELKVKDWEELMSNTDLNKSFQLLMYAYLYKKQSVSLDKRVTSGIITFRKLSSGVKNVTINGNEELTDSTIHLFEAQLKKLVEEIYNLHIPFSQTTDQNRCEYCNFKLICNR